MANCFAEPLSTSPFQYSAGWSESTPFKLSLSSTTKAKKTVWGWCRWAPSKVRELDGCSPRPLPGEAFYMDDEDPVQLSVDSRVMTGPDHLIPREPTAVESGSDEQVLIELPFKSPDSPRWKYHTIPDRFCSVHFVSLELLLRARNPFHLHFLYQAHDSATETPARLVKPALPPIHWTLLTTRKWADLRRATRSYKVSVPLTVTVAKGWKFCYRMLKLRFGWGLLRKCVRVECKMSTRRRRRRRSCDMETRGLEDSCLCYMLK